MCLVALASGCDFTPVLDIPLPEHEPGLVVQSILFADSTVSVFVGLSVDAYNRRDPLEAQSPSRLLVGATVELLEEESLVDRLSVRPGVCDRRDDMPEITDECGLFVSDTVARIGRSYTVRVRADGFEEAFATVRVPKRAEVVGAVGRDGSDVSFTLRDPEGLGQSYAIRFRQRAYRSEYTRPVRNEDGSLAGRDTTIIRTGMSTPGFTTTDPFLIAAARVIPDSYALYAAFDDTGFDGQQHTFSISAFDGTTHPELLPDPGALWVLTLDPTLYKANKVTSFSLGDDSPFEEPGNLPSNVIGGYGLVGAATVTEYELPESPARRVGL